MVGWTVSTQAYASSSATPHTPHEQSSSLPAEVGDAVRVALARDAVLLQKLLPPIQELTGAKGCKGTTEAWWVEPCVRQQQAGGGASWRRPVAPAAAAAEWAKKPAGETRVWIDSQRYRGPRTEAAELDSLLWSRTSPGSPASRSSCARCCSRSGAMVSRRTIGCLCHQTGCRFHALRPAPLPPRARCALPRSVQHPSSSAPCVQPSIDILALRKQFKQGEGKQRDAAGQCTSKCTAACDRPLSGRPSPAAVLTRPAAAPPAKPPLRMRCRPPRKARRSAGLLHCLHSSARRHRPPPGRAAGAAAPQTHAQAARPPAGLQMGRGSEFGRVSKQEQQLSASSQDSSSSASWLNVVHRRQPQQACKPHLPQCSQHMARGDTDVQPALQPAQAHLSAAAPRPPPSAACRPLAVSAPARVPAQRLAALLLVLLPQHLPVACTWLDYGWRAACDENRG